MTLTIKIVENCWSKQIKEYNSYVDKITLKNAGMIRLKFKWHTLCHIIYVTYKLSMDMNRENLIKTILKSVNMRFVITFQGTRLLQTNKIALNWTSLNRKSTQPLKRNVSVSTFVETICDIFGSEAKEEFVEEIYYLILKDPSTTPDWSMIFGYSLDKAGNSNQ